MNDKRTAGKTLMQTIVIIIVAVIVLIILVRAVSKPKVIHKNTGTQTESHPALEEMISEELQTKKNTTSSHMKIIRSAFLTFQKNQGRFPTAEEFGKPIFTSALDSIIQLDSTGYPIDAWGNRFQFNPTLGINFGFHSNGPDGKAGIPETDRDNVR